MKCKCVMEFTPSSAPVYGGGLIVLDLPEDVFIPDDSRLFLVFEGSTQRQITEAKLDGRTLKAVIPDHEPPEELDLSLVFKSEDNDDLTCLFKTVFTFYLDQTCYLARYLADSVHVMDGLENWDDIQGPQFSLEHEEFESLDDRLTSAFEHLILPVNWSLLGDPTAEDQRRETLFHFAARLGLTSFVTLLLDKNGSEECLAIRNKHGSLAHDIARDRGYNGLADLMTDPHAHGVIRWKSTQRINDYTVVKRHSFGTVTTSSEFIDGSWPPIDEELQILSNHNSDVMQERGVCTQPVYPDVGYHEAPPRPMLPPKPIKLLNNNNTSLKLPDESEYVVGDFDDYHEQLSAKYASINQPQNRAAILGDSFQQLQELSEEVQQMQDKDIEGGNEGARLSISCPDLGQDIMLVSSEYLNYDDASSSGTCENEEYFEEEEQEESSGETSDDDDDVEEAILRPHSWHLNDEDKPVNVTNNRLSAPNLTHKRSQSMVNSTPAQKHDDDDDENVTDGNKMSSVISPAVRRVRRHNNHTFAVVGSQNDISHMGHSASTNNNNNAHDDRRFTISEGVLSPPTNFENINSKPPVPPPPDKNKVSRKLSFLNKVRNSTRMRPNKEKIKKTSITDGKIISEEKLKQSSTENVSDSRESLRELAWLNVKSKVKKTSNQQKPSNMMINKLPTTYGNSLPNPSFFMQNTSSKTLSTLELSQKFNNDGNSSESSEKRLSGYVDDDSISIQSGVYSSQSSSQLTSMRDNSSSLENIGPNVQYQTELRKDPDLSLRNDIPETWSLTVDKKLLKKMSKKDTKRQENIYEFFQKEQNFLTTLKIMQKIFAQGMRYEANVDDATINTMFPNIDEFVDYTQQFVVKLRERQEMRDDKVVDEIGDLLVEQWSGESAKFMTELYSMFCCKQNEIVQLYKDLQKSDKKFQDFIVTSRKNPLTRRRGVQECLLLVTQRITKYQIMVKSLLDNTTDKKYKGEISNLQTALNSVTQITVAVNSCVQEYEKQLMLKKIWQSMESKVVTYNETRKFSKDDLINPIRKLEHYAHDMQWKSNSKDSKKQVDVTLLLFTDCLVLLHESNQRYSFASNGQPAIVPLHKLIVRDIANELQGFYLISAGSQVEMYTFYCDKEDKCKHWMQQIRTAAQNCPEEDEGVTLTEEERKQEEKWSEAHERINELETRDRRINALLEEKMENFKKLAALSDKGHLLDNMSFRYPTYTASHNEDLPPGSPILQKAIEQVAKLTHAIHGPGGVARHPSSVGEGQSGTYITPVLPKRSETFGGFDNGEQPPVSLMNKAAPQEDSDTESKTESTKRDSGLIMADYMTGNLDNASLEVEVKVTAPPQDRLPLSDHQVTTLAQLTHLLNQYLSVATQQDTNMEKMKLELEQAKEKSFTRRKLGSNLQEVEALRYKSKQQQQEQELTKQQQRLLLDKVEWNKEMERQQNSLEVTQSEVSERLSSLKKREEEMEKEQEEVKKTKEHLQRDMARLRELQKRIQSQEPSTMTSSYSSLPTINHNNSNNHEEIFHRNLSDDKLNVSKSELKQTSPTYQTAADYPRTFPVGKKESSVNSHPTLGGASSSSFLPQQSTLPIHLQYSATNQARPVQVSQLPGKLTKLSKKASAPNTSSNVHQVIPNKLSGLSSKPGNVSGKGSHHTKFTDGIRKHRMPFAHPSKYSSKDHGDNTSLKHSKSETAMEGRSKPAQENFTTQIDSGNVERSNSASSNSSKEGSEKKKKRSSLESDKKSKEVFYL